MPQTPESTNASDWHRYFAIECNNRAWTLSVKKRSAEEDAEMLDLAHTAAYHWNAVGTEQNTMRAKALLAEVHAAIGNGPIAITYAKSIGDYFIGNKETPDWELALTHVIVAHAAAAAGQGDLHRKHYELASQSIKAIADEEDRAIVNETFVLVPKPR